MPVETSGTAGKRGNIWGTICSSPFPFSAPLCRLPKNPIASSLQITEPVSLKFQRFLCPKSEMFVGMAGVRKPIARETQSCKIVSELATTRPVWAHELRAAKRRRLSLQAYGQHVWFSVGAGPNSARGSYFAAARATAASVCLTVVPWPPAMVAPLMRYFLKASPAAMVMSERSIGPRGETRSVI
jgi:hypothetical protein